MNILKFVQFKIFRNRSRTSSESTSSSRSSSSSSQKKDSGSDRDAKKQPTTTTTSLFDPKSKKLEDLSLMNWHLAQKSETLMFDDQPSEDKNANETFVWRKKNTKFGLDKFDPKDLILLNKAKQDETQVNINRN